MSPDFVDGRRSGGTAWYTTTSMSPPASRTLPSSAPRRASAMFYVVPEEFCRVHGESLLGISGLKWRSKREVVGWLIKFAPQRDDSKSLRVGSQHNLGDEALQNDNDDCGPGLDGSLKAHASDIVWSGVSWVISAECVDGPATVLTPDHYERYVTAVPYASVGIYLCSRQCNKNRFKPFYVTSLSGYFNQPALSYLDIFTMPAEEGLGNGGSARDPIQREIRLGKGHQSFLTDSLVFSPTGNESHVASSRLPTNDMRYSLPVKRSMSVKSVGPRQWLTPPYKVDGKI